MVPTQPFSACKCIWCVRMSTSSIEMIITLLTQTIGPNWACTSVLIHSSRHILSSPGHFVSRTHHHLPSQCNRRICPTTTSHMLPHHRTTLLTPQMLLFSRPSFLHCWLIIVVDCATCPMCPSNLESSRKKPCHQQRHGLYSMMNSHVMLSRSSNSVGLCTPSTVAISHQLFNLGTCPFKFDWHRTRMSPADHYSRNSHHAATSSAVLQIS